jgi:hypothetical protein
LPSVESVSITSESDGTAFGRLAGSGRPHQRHRLGQVADVIVAELEQHRISALRDQRADHAGLGVLERQRAGQRRERKAALRVWRGAEVIGDQPQLVVAAGLIGEAVE